MSLLLRLIGVNACISTYRHRPIGLRVLICLYATDIHKHTISAKPQTRRSNERMAIPIYRPTVPVLRSRAQTLFAYIGFAVTKFKYIIPL